MSGEETPETLEELAHLIWYGGFSCWRTMENSIPDTPERNTRRFFLLFDFLHVLLYFCRLLAYEVAGQERGLKLADQIDGLVMQSMLLDLPCTTEADRGVLETDFAQGLDRSRESYSLCVSTSDGYEDLFRLFGRHAAADVGLSDEPLFAYKAQMLAMSAVRELDPYSRLADIVR